MMDLKVFTDRSRCEQYQRCPRSRWLAYHEGPERLGIQAARKPLPLAVGGAVHVGLADLLKSASAPGWDGSEGQIRLAENIAVTQALDDFEEFAGGRLETDAAETDAQDLSAFDEVSRARVRSEVDQYLYDEQRALVEAMVRAYARRRLRPLLEEYEVLEVEREGEWRLGEVIEAHGTTPLWFMSRPDALLRDRQSNNLYIQSFKTGANWDPRKGEDAKHDAQGLSEGVEIEKRLGVWWEIAKKSDASWLPKGEYTEAMRDFLRSLDAPPRILGIRYEFLWKGQRREDRDLTARFGVTAYAQRSHLVRGYLNAGMASGDESWNWSWDYVKDTGEPSKLYWKAWRSAAVWESMPIAKWIDMLDATVETVGEEGTAKGWSGPAQATGFTAAHPLDLVFHPPIIVYRNDDDLRDWIESTEAQEARVAADVARVRAARDEGERRSLLNVLFPMSRHACVYPSLCQFAGGRDRVGVCYAGEHVRENPLASGEYRVREVNHPQERGGGGDVGGGEVGP